jgi:tRNA(Ile)-lysidine synthase
VPVEGDWPNVEDKDFDLLLSAQYGFLPVGQTQVAVAVSGGGDSIALLHLVHRAAPHMGWRVSAVTVDHGLRPEAAGEAAGVARFCETLGIAHTILRWDHGVISGNLMDEARKAREALIRDWALAQGILHVAVGHTADDQAETFLMGLGRAAGLDGLSGMGSFWRKDGVNWSRPLLHHSRAELRAYLVRHGISWVDDPTNEDDRFTRIKARKALAALAPLGITVESLETSISHLSVARHALKETLLAAVKSHVKETAGGLTIGRAAYTALPMDIRRRFLMASIAWLSGDQYAPRTGKQANLLFAMNSNKDTTLNGCRFRCKSDAISINREPKAVVSATCPPDQPWDGRWLVEGPAEPGLEVRALGAAGLRACKDWRATGHSRDALLVSPAIWRGEVLVAAPLAGFSGGWTARIDAGFSSFIISH